MSHKTNMIFACSSLLVALTACIDEQEFEIQARAITVDEINRVVASEIYRDYATVLDHQGEKIILASGQIWTEPLEGISSAVFPVRRAGQLRAVGEFAYFIVDIDAEREPVEGNLELTPGFEAADAGTHVVGPCEPWGPWEMVSERCDDWSWWCYGEANMVLRERSRICTVDGESWIEVDESSVRRTCGC